MSKPEKAFVTNCHIICREDDGPLFHADPANGLIHPYLDKYTILPSEDYEALRAENERLQARVDAHESAIFENSLRPIMERTAKIASVDDRGFYITLDTGIHYLYSDGVIRPSVSYPGADAFWPTKESAETFLSGWRTPPTPGY